MVKFVNILIGGAITPINVEDVVTVAATAIGFFPAVIMNSSAFVRISKLFIDS